MLRVSGCKVEVQGVGFKGFSQKNLANGVRGSGFTVLGSGVRSEVWG